MMEEFTNFFDLVVDEEPTPAPAEVAVCAQNPCQNGGVCNDVVGEIHCLCAEGFRGERCDSKIKFEIFQQNCFPCL